MAVVIGKGPPRSADEARAELAQVLPARLATKITQEALAEYQDEILLRSMNVVDGSMRFAEIDQSATEPPLAWVEELGEEQAWVRFRAAKAGWEGSKMAPAALKVATAVAIGILRAKAAVDAAPKVLNMQFVQMSAPVPTFPEQEIEPGKRR